MFLLILNYPRTEIEPRAAIANQPDISGDGTWKYYRTRPHGWMWPPSQKTPVPTRTIAKLDNANPLNDIAVYTLYRYCLDDVDMIVWQHAHDMRIMLTHLPLVPHMYASVNWINIGSGKGLAPIRRQAITWTTVHVLSNGLSEKKNQWNSNKYTKLFIQENAFENVVCEIAAILSRWDELRATIWSRYNGVYPTAVIVVATILIPVMLLPSNL